MILVANKVYTNRAKAILFAIIAGVAYAIPLAICAIINSEKLFKDTGTSLTFFSVLLIIFFVIFAKKLVKKICGAVTVIGFASIVMLILSVAVRNLIDQLYIISIASVIGAVLAWLPTQIATVFAKYSKDDKGALKADLTLKDVLQQLFGLTA